MNDKTATSHRLSEECKRLLKLLAQKLGISQTDVIEIAVREKAERSKVE